MGRLQRMIRSADGIDTPRRADIQSSADDRVIGYQSNGRYYVTERGNADAWIYAGEAFCLEQMR